MLTSVSRNELSPRNGNDKLVFNGTLRSSTEGAPSNSINPRNS